MKTGGEAVSNQEITNIAEAVSEKVVLTSLARIGLDLTNPYEVQQDMAYIRKWRQQMETMASKALITVLGLIVIGAVAFFWDGLTASFRGGSDPSVNPPYGYTDHQFRREGGRGYMDTHPPRAPTGPWSPVT